MSSVLVINAAGRETRVALVENGHIAEFYLERKKDKGIVGNVYKGRVTRVLPGMQAAFVDIGQDKAAFLYVGDVLFDPDVARHQFDLTEGEQDDDVPEVPDESDELHAHHGSEGGEAAGASAEHVEHIEHIEEFELEASPATSEMPTPPPVPEGQLERGDRQVETSGEVSLVPPAPPLEALAPTPLPTPAPAEPSVTGSEVLVAAVAESAAPPSPAPPAVTPPTPPAAEKLETPRSGAPRDVRFKERRDERRDKGRDRERKPEPRKQQRIEDLLKVGQEVLVQVSKDPIGTKGARLTSHISIPGRHLVFMPTVDHVGISRRIGNEKERRRLRDIVERLRPPGTGFIVRTVAENVPQE
jgi:ribonuclease G